MWRGRHIDMMMFVAFCIFANTTEERVSKRSERIYIQIKHWVDRKFFMQFWTELNKANLSHAVVMGNGTRQLQYEYQYM